MRREEVAVATRKETVEDSLSGGVGSFVLLRLGSSKRPGSRAVIEAVTKSAEAAEKRATELASAAGARFAIAKIEKVFELKLTYRIQAGNELFADETEWACEHGPSTKKSEPSIGAWHVKSS
jgi:hypothetical protein